MIFRKGWWALSFGLAIVNMATAAVNMAIAAVAIVTVDVEIARPWQS